MFDRVFFPIVAVLVLGFAIWQPIQTRRVRDGWKPKRFKGTHEEFVAKYRRQFRTAWGSVAVGVLILAIGLFSVLAHERGHWWRLLGGVVFLTLGGVSLWCRRILDSSPKTRAGTSEEETV
jgi:hypothetical protein